MQSTEQKTCCKDPRRNDTQKKKTGPASPLLRQFEFDNLNLANVSILFLAQRMRLKSTSHARIALFHCNNFIYYKYKNR